MMKMRAIQGSFLPVVSQPARSGFGTVLFFHS
jgi:hypothetical protein